MHQLAGLLILLLTCEPVLAHSADRGFILLLPRSLYITGGTLAVLASFFLIAFLRPADTAGSARQSWFLRSLDLSAGFTRSSFGKLCTIISLLSAALLMLLMLVGWMGTTDPLRNLLPLMFWTFFWVLFPLMHVDVGHIWRLLNPWHGPARLLRALTPIKQPPFKLPGFLGYWLAVPGILLFAWYELVSLSPEDPPQLASVIAIYWLVHLLGVLLFGEKAWLGRVEPFSVFFHLLSLLAPVSRTVSKDDNTGLVIRLHLWGAKLLTHPALPISAAVFILLTLATVSFDGLNKTFWWLHLNHINPLAFEGRSTVWEINTLGLLVSAMLLTLLFFGSVALGLRMAGSQRRFAETAGILALAIIPISLAYHFSHYLTQILVNGQYLLVALSDPFDNGWNLLGFADYQVTTSFLSHEHSVRWLWYAQLAVIVTGHIFSALLGHLLSFRLHDDHRQAVVSQIPLAVLMVAYTLFGLWLLSTPTGV